MKINNLKLNFLDSYYLFYDWLATDEIEVRNNVPIYKVSSKMIDDLLTSKIKLKNLLEDVVLFTDDFTYIAVDFNENGISECKSSLLLEDEIKVSKQASKLEISNISYEVVSFDKPTKDLRINDIVRNIIKIELNQITQKIDVDKLKYLYYEWFNKTGNDFNAMIGEMQKRLNKPLTSKEVGVYNIIKKSYKMV